MRIKSVKSVGKEDVYDIVNSGTSNFLTENGIVLHNCIDEANFMEVTEGSKRARNEVYDAAEEMYNSITSRMSSRFMKNGAVPGLLVMASSPRYHDDFLERKIKEATSRGPAAKIFWRKRNIWEAKGEKFYPASRGYFYINTDTLREVGPEYAKRYEKLKSMMKGEAVET